MAATINEKNSGAGTQTGQEILANLQDTYRASQNLAEDIQAENLGKKTVPLNQECNALLLKPARGASFKPIKALITSRYGAHYISERKAYSIPLSARNDVETLLRDKGIKCSPDPYPFSDDYFRKNKSGRDASDKWSRVDFLEGKYYREDEQLRIDMHQLEREIRERLFDETDKTVEQKRKEFKDREQLQIALKDEIDQLRNSARLLEEFNDKNPTDAFIIEPGKTHMAAVEGRKILSNPIHGVFRRSGQTVWLSNYKKSELRKKPIDKQDGAIQISEVNEPFLIEKLSEIHSWMKYDAKMRQNKSIDFPSMAARMILSRKGEDLQYLKGFINAPTIRLDGSLLTKPGYDEETGLFFDPLGTKFQEIPDEPTKDDAVFAVSVLLGLINGFPFEDEVSKAVALSELMTSVIRRSLPLAPIFANDAPSASSGKSLLAKLGSYISTGKAPTMVSPSRNEEEMRKRIASCLIDGDLVLCIDNVDFPLESRDLCIVSTSEIWRERILGESKNAEIETNAQIIITGNNLSIVGDLCTRTLKCRLVPMVEHPEERYFNIDLNSYIPQNRGSLAMAILTIIRAYIVAGEPMQSAKGFREYTNWCRLVRDPLLWIGCADPCESVRRVQDMDPKRSEMESIFGAIKAFPADSFTSKHLIDSASNRAKRDEDAVYQRLYDVLIDIAGKKDGEICPIKLGNKLKEYKDRICNGIRLKEVGKDRTNKTVWKLVSA